jgi:hypothetical protein
MKYSYKMNNDLESHVAEMIPRLFASRGIVASVEPGQPSGSRRPDFWCHLAVDGRDVRIAAEVKSRWSQAILDQIGSPASPERADSRLLILPKLSPAVRSRLRQLRINHADLSGVLYLNAPGIRVDVDGDPASQDAVLKRHPRELNPFSKKASLVLRVLLAGPKEPMRVLELAEQAGVAAGWASEVSDALVQRGYAKSSAEGVRLVDPVSALRDWSAAYNWKKNPRRNFVVPFDYDEIPGKLMKAFRAHAVEWALTLLAGAQRRIGHVRYSAMLHVYARQEHAAAISDALKDLYAEETAGEGGLTVLEPYYGGGAFFGAELANGNPVVSDVQLFLDLAHFPVRGPEAAEVLVRRRIAPALSLGKDDIKQLLRDLV